MTPRRALRDPDLAFNLTVMRAADAAKKYRSDLRTSGLTAEEDPFGVAHIAAELRSLNEDS